MKWECSRKHFYPLITCYFNSSFIGKCYHYPWFTVERMGTQKVSEIHVHGSEVHKASFRWINRRAVSIPPTPVFFSPSTTTCTSLSYFWYLPVSKIYSVISLLITYNNYLKTTWGFCILDLLLTSPPHIIISLFLVKSVLSVYSVITMLCDSLPNQLI